MTMQTLAITTLGCKINQFESAAMTESLGRRGYRIVPFTEKADIYVINTCTVTARTDAESRRLIRRAARLNPAARIVVTGCYAQVAPDALAEMPEVDLVVGNREKKGIEGLLEVIGGERVVVSDIFEADEADQLRLETFAEHTRAFLQIQNGCNEFCAYCIVPYARGKSRSVPFDEVLEGIRAFSARGYREVVLTGIHLGAYGLDLRPQRTLLDLIETADGLRLAGRLRLGSVEPQEIDDAFISFLGRAHTVCPHLHIPLQSGSATVLQRMGRKYTPDHFRSLLEKLTAVLPDICIGADIIAGFPGETEDEFQESYRLVASLPIAYLHVFPYSARPGTPAATMRGRVHDATVKERVRALNILSDTKKADYCRKFVGRELPVLFLNKGKDGVLNGLSGNYLQVSATGGNDLVNRELPVRITGVDGVCARGEIVSAPAV